MEAEFPEVRHGIGEGKKLTEYLEDSAAESNRKSSIPVYVAASS
jgi:hypothetical protein